MEEQMIAVTTPNGATVWVPKSHPLAAQTMSGDLKFQGDVNFTGGPDPEFMGDIDEAIRAGDIRSFQDMPYAGDETGDMSGEPDEFRGDYFGDMLVGALGKNRAKKVMKRINKRLAKLGKAPVSDKPSAALAQLPPADRAALVTKIEAQQQNAALGSGGSISKASIAPIFSSHGSLINRPTRAMIPGNILQMSVERFENTYPGSTREQVAPNSSGTVVFTFAAPTAAEGGNVSVIPMIFVEITMERQTSLSNSRIGLQLTARDEAGVAITGPKWTIANRQALKTLFVAMIPYTEVSSALYPRLVQATVTFNLVLTITGLPDGSYVVVTLPGLDNDLYANVKQKMGMFTPTGLVANAQ